MSEFQWKENEIAQISFFLLLAKNLYSLLMTFLGKKCHHDFIYISNYNMFFSK